MAEGVRATTTTSDQWLRDVLTELSGVAHGYRPSMERAQRVLSAVPREVLRAAGLAPLSSDAAQPQTLSEALGHHDPDGTCSICVAFREEMAAIAESERQAWIRTKDVIIRD